jgi:hypothetical protein
MAFFLCIYKPRFYWDKTAYLGRAREKLATDRSTVEISRIVSSCGHPIGTQCLDQPGMVPETQRHVKCIRSYPGRDDAEVQS